MNIVYGQELMASVPAHGDAILLDTMHNVSQAFEAMGDRQTDSKHIELWWTVKCLQESC